ncbi:MAG: hypothetical protein KDB80_18200 [Planctomycetes bacterium]|nr:hypothetical protein [Planctomycetota bacterium]
MISAPIIPRTHESLWDLLEGEPERIERGFQLIQRELVIEDGIVVDALGCDTAGRLTLVFLAGDGLDGDYDIALRVFVATQWVNRHERLLLSALPDAGVRIGATLRVIVVGFEFSETCVATLRNMNLADLAMYRCEAFVLDGHLHAGMSPVFGATADGADDTPTVPRGVANADLERVGSDIIQLVQKIDPNVEVRGDRYSRRFYSTHGLLAELFLVGDRLFIAGVGHDDEPQPVRASDARRIADAIARNYLEQLAQPENVRRRDAALERALADAVDSQPESQTTTRDRLRIDHTLHPLPRAPMLDDTEVSQEEFDAFSGLSSEAKDP